MKRTYKVKVFDVQDRDEQGCKLLTELSIDATGVTELQRAIRAKLEGDHAVRSINLMAGEENCAVVYVQDKPEPGKPKQRGKPVIHIGPVGRGRKIERD